MSHCCFRSLPLEIYKNLCPPLHTITFTVNKHADNHFYKHIYLLQILYIMKSVFLLRYMWRFFIFKFDLNVKHLLFFQIKKHDLPTKTFFRKQYETIIELHAVHMRSHAIWVTGVIKSTKKINKTKTFWKNNFFK